MVPEAVLKGGLLEVAAKTNAGITHLDRANQAIFQQLRLEELPALCPLEEPTHTELFTGEWECRWADEKQLKFVVKSGTIRMGRARWPQNKISIQVSPAEELAQMLSRMETLLRNMLVGSSIAPDLQ